MQGNFIISKAGHDKGVLYIVLKEDDTYVYVVDGKYKLVEHPKRKNVKHIQIIVKKADSYIQNKIQQGFVPSNQEIWKAIQNYSN
jgi:ribosomal protein L14E/L6E/L27E